MRGWGGKPAASPGWVNGRPGVIQAQAPGEGLCGWGLFDAHGCETLMQASDGAATSSPRAQAAGEGLCVGGLLQKDGKGVLNTAMKSQLG